MRVSLHIPTNDHSEASSSIKHDPSEPRLSTDGRGTLQSSSEALQAGDLFRIALVHNKSWL
jgi:hypothetical protein